MLFCPKTHKCHLNSLEKLLRELFQTFFNTYNKNEMISYKLTIST